MAGTEMNIDTVRAITTLETTLKDTKADIQEIKNDIKDLKGCYPSKEAFDNLKARVEKLEANQARLVWIVISTVVGSGLLLILK